MFDTRSFSVRLRAEVLGYVAGMKQAATVTRAAGVSATEAAVAHKAASQTIGRASLVGGAALLGLAATAVKVAATFDHQMSAVSAATHESVKAMGQLRAAALEAGKSTVFSATEAAQAETELAKAGVSTADILGGGLAGSLSLASAGSLEVADAAEIAATAMTQFGLSGKDIPHVADLLAAGAGKAQGEVSDLAQALQYVGPVAAGMGVSIEQTVGALAEFASKGQIGERAGTGLRGVLLSLTSPGKQAAAEMASLGIELYDASGQFIGIDGAAQELQSSLGKLSPAARDAALGVIFGNQQVTAARVLYEGGAESVNKWTGKVDDSGYAADTAARKMDNLVGDLNNLQSSFETALIESGSGANGALRGLTKGATGTVNAFGDLPGPVQGSATVISALGGTALIAAGAFATLTPKISATRKILTETGPAGATANRGLAAAGRGATGMAMGAVAVVAFSVALKKLSDVTYDAAPGLQAVKSQLIDLSQGTTTAATVADVTSLTESLKTLRGGILDLPQKAIGLATFGLAPDNNALREAKENVSQIDQALADMVTSGHAAAAGKAINELTAGDPQRRQELLGHLTEYKAALGDASNTQKLAAGSSTQLAGSLDDTSASLDGDTKAVDAYLKSLTELTQTLYGTQSAQDDLTSTYHGLVDQVTAAVKAGDAGARSLKGNSDAAIANRGALQGIVGKTADVVAEMVQHGKTTDQVNGYIARQADRLDAVGRKLGLNRAEVRKYTADLKNIPDNIPTEIQMVGIDGAIARVAELAWQLNHVPKSVTVGVFAHIAANPPGGATGGYVTGPGTATSDSILARLSHGEYIVQSSAVAHYGVGLLSALNARKLAAGGPASGHPTAAGTAAAVSRVVSHAGDSVAEIKAATAAVEKLTQAYEDQRATVGMNAKEKRRYYAEQRIDAAKERLDTRSANATARAEDKAAAKKQAAEDAAEAKKQHAQDVADAADNVVRDAQDAIDAAKQVRDSYATQVSDSITSYGAIGAGINVAASSGEVTGSQVGATDVLTGGLIARAQAARFAQAQTFAANMRTLRAAGLNNTSLQQILAMGPDGGSGYAAALVADTSVIASINGTQSGIDQLAGEFGSDMAGGFYQAGVDTAQGFLDGLASTSPAIASAVQRLADTLVADMRTALDAHSPSMRMHREVGVTIPAGILSGMEAGAPAVNDYLNKMVATPSTPQYSTARVTSATNTGESTFHLYDSDGQLMGTMRGAASEVVGQVADSAYYGRVG